MFGISWRAGRVAVVVAVLALLAAVPAVLVAVHVENPWALGGATASAGLVVGLGAVWQARYLQLVQRRGDEAFRTEDGCLVRADGSLPKVRDLIDPLLLGVHKASAAVISAQGPGGEPVSRVHVPVYVPRDIDADLRESLAAGGLVLLVGDSTAGKSRSAFESMTATLADHQLICPGDRAALAVAVTRAAQARRCVLWLDDLERFLGIGGLNAARLARLLTANEAHRVIIATMRAAEQARLTSEDPSGDDTARQVLRDARQLIEQAHTIRVSRMFSDPELERACARHWDPRIAEALDHSGTYGIAEYIAAGPELLRDWEDARSSSTGPNARGAALVAAAIDIRRAGHTSPIRRPLIDQVHEFYLGDTEHLRIPREPLSNAWEWATCNRHATASLLQPTQDGRVVAFDYLVDTIQRRHLPGDHVSEVIVGAAIDASDPADADSLADLAYQQGRFVLAERAYRKAWQAKTSHPDFGSEHPSTLTSRDYHALALRGLARREESEAEHRAVLQIRSRLLGDEHPSTLTSRDYHARSLGYLGQYDEAEAEHQAVLQIRTQVLGPEHPDTLNSRHNCASLLRERGRLQESEAEHYAVLQLRTRVLGNEHPDTLLSRNSRAVVLRGLGRLREAEAEFRATMAISCRVLGDEHPDTLLSRDNLAVALRALGRLDEAEAEHSTILQIRTQLLGEDHPSTLTSRDNHAIVLRALGRLDEAEAEHSTVLEIRDPTAGREIDPDTLRSRNNRAVVLRGLGRLEEALAEHHANLAISSRILGDEHPDTLSNRDNFAVVLRGLGRLDEAEAEHRTVLEIRTRLLGKEHPSTLTSRD